MSSPTATPLLSIGELARQVGAAPSAIRYWERAGLLDPAERVGGRRRYRPDAIDRVGLIRVCQDVGFHIHEIRELLASDSLDDAQWRSRAEQKIAQMKDEIARLQAAVEGLQHTLTCPHPSLSACPVFTAHVTHRRRGASTRTNSLTRRAMRIPLMPPSPVGHERAPRCGDGGDLPRLA